MNLIVLLISSDLSGRNPKNNKQIELTEKMFLIDKLPDCYYVILWIRYLWLNKEFNNSINVSEFFHELLFILFSVINDSLFNHRFCGA